MKLVIEQCNFIRLSESTNAKGVSRHWAEFADGIGQGKLTSTTVDLLAIPKLVPVTVEADVQPFLWGNSLVLDVISITIKAINGRETSK